MNSTQERSGTLVTIFWSIPWYILNEICLALEERGNATGIDGLSGMVLIDGHVNNLVILEADLRNFASAHKFEGAQIVCDMLSVCTMFVVNVEYNGLDDSCRSISEIFELIDVLISTTSVVAGVGHVEKSVKKTFGNTFVREAWVHEQLHFECEPIHARLITVVVEIDKTDDLFSNVPLTADRSIALVNCDQVW